MKHFYTLVFSTFLASSVVSVQAQEVKGNIIDDKGKAVAYANIVALSLPDSSYVAGVMSADDGSFRLEADPKAALLRISSVGYKTVFVALKDDIGTITIVPDAKLLGEITVKSPLPKTRLKADAMVTTVSGTILETAGSMEKMLDRIPNVSARNGNIEVFGRGKPLIYINGRKMFDASELERLSPDNIQSVEVVTNPGARYEASATSVIRIKTKKAVGEGFGLSNKLFAEVNDYGYLVGQDRLNMNWRKGGLDIGGTFSASRWSSPDPKSMGQITHLENTWRQMGKIDQVSKTINLYGRFAISYMFNENHSIGANVSFSRSPGILSTGDMHTTLTRDMVQTETLKSNMDYNDQSTNLQGNAYYVGKVGKWGIDFNADWLWGKSFKDMNTHETYQETGKDAVVNEVSTESDDRNQLFASRLVLTAPLLGGELSFGGEYSYSKRKSLYWVVPKEIIDDDASRIEEGMASAFVEYQRKFGPVNVQAGVRYENVDFDYYDNGKYKADQSRVFNNVFPSLALSAALGKLNLQLGWSSDIRRPSYNMLRSRVNYDNRYTYEGGNPFLVPTKSNNVNFAASYKWILLSMGWSHIIDPIFWTSETYKDDPAVALLRNVNGESYDKVFASLNVNPKFGIWQPQLMLAVQKQWSKMTVYGRNPLSRPIGTFRFSNTLDTKWVQVALHLSCATRGSDGNQYFYKHYFLADLSLYKAFLKGKLTASLYVSDIFKTGGRHLVIYSGPVRDALYDGRSVRTANLTVVYKFNFGANKYKGTGAGKEQKSRM